MTVGQPPGSTEASRRESPSSVPGWLQGKEELVLTTLLFAFGVYILADTHTIRTPASFSQIGPRFVPYVVGGLLTAVSILLTVEVLRGRPGQAEETDLVDPRQRTNWRALLMVAAVIIVHGVLIDRVGWMVATSFLFWGVAFATGSRRWVLDPIIAVVVAVSVFLIFTELLSVRLPGGVFGVGA